MHVFVTLPNPYFAFSIIFANFAPVFKKIIVFRRFMKRRFLLFLAVMLLNVMAALGQTKISGTVVFQDDGEPVIGASVLVEGNKAGTITNIDGEFTLEVPAGKKIQVS